MTALLVLAMGALFAALALLRPAERGAYLIVGGYALPMYLFTALSDPGYGPPDLRIPQGAATTGRILVHVGAFLLLLMLVGFRRRAIRIPAIVYPVTLSLMWMLVIAFNSGDGESLALRTGMTGVMAINLFVFIPSLVVDPAEHLHAMGRATTVLGIALMFLALAVTVRFGFFPSYTVRFGRPLNPNVMGILLFLGFVGAAASRAPLWPRAIFAAGLVATGSRASLALAGLLTVFLWLRGRRFRVTGIALGALLTLGLIIVSPPDSSVTGSLLGIGDEIYGQRSLTSGRFELWQEALEVISQSPLRGTGHRLILEDRGPVDVSRAHNFFLEAAASYGVPMALLGFAFYGLLVFGVLVRTQYGLSAVHRDVARFLALGLLGLTLVSTISWMNLGDGANIIAMAFLTPLLIRRSVGVRGDNGLRDRSVSFAGGAAGTSGPRQGL